VTTNRAGFLSPYGEFLPMQPGPAALVTLPDLDTGQRGTGIVHVIKLQLDVNHDGTMDLSFGGPDNTSQERPFVFWLNNDHDAPGHGGAPDRELPCPPAAPDYLTGGIYSARDLEDYARLWFIGLPPLSAANGYSVSLSWGTIASGHPSILIFQAWEADGGIAYLTNAFTAADQLNSSDYNRSIGTVSNSALAFPPDAFAGGGNYHFLFEAAGVGSGQLMLTVSQGTNILAQTSAWLDLRDVKDMFEQARVTNVVTTFPAMRNTINTSDFTIDHQLPTSSDEAKEVIVLVHGWNNDPWQSENYAETMFKRLFWQGYRGRFVALRWPTLSGETDPWTSLLTYNRSEYIAFRSATGASAYFDWLRARFLDYTINVCAHSMGNVLMMEALKLQLAAGSHSIDNYVLMEAAVPAHCYDTNAPVCPGLFTTETPPQTPDTYRGYPGAINAALRPGGHMFNFFNTNDFALAAWVGNQLLNKPQPPWYYMGPNLQPYLFPSTPVTDPREVMAFAARPRSYAVGAQPGVDSVILGSEVDLAGAFGFGREESDHSGQFNRAIQQVLNFYFTLLRRLNNSQP
jgi:hypothetical protein